MKCRKCQKRNSYKAKYCYYCGTAFSEEERKKAKKSGIVGILSALKDIKDTLTSGKLKGSLIYRIGSILIVLAIGIAGVMENGLHLKVEESSEYTYQYKKDTNEYFLFTDQEETKLNLYSLNTKKITVRFYVGKSLLEEKEISDLNDVKLLSSDGNSHYEISSNKDTILLHVYNNNKITKKNV